MQKCIAEEKFKFTKWKQQFHVLENLILSRVISKYLLRVVKKPTLVLVASFKKIHKYYPNGVPICIMTWIIRGQITRKNSVNLYKNPQFFG